MTTILVTVTAEAGLDVASCVPEVTVGLTHSHSDCPRRWAADNQVNFKAILLLR